MNLSEPLDGLTGPVEAAILRVLARSETGFSGRQVHALSGVGSVSSVHRALARLVTVGLVTDEARPPAIIYRANRQHLLWPAVELALAARSRFFDSLRAFCAAEVPEELGVTVLVYGSVARRESAPESDVDLFVVYPDDIDEDARADFGYQIARHVEGVTGNEAQVYSVQRAELAQRIAGREPLVQNVVSEGVLVFGPRLDETSRGRAA